MPEGGRLYDAFKLTFAALCGLCELSANEIKYPIDRKEFMKRVILTTVIVAVATASVFAQGTVNFQGNTVRVLNPDGTLLGAGGLAQLVGAPGSNAPESNLILAINPPSTFRTGPGAGGTVPSFIATFNNITPDAPFGSFEMVAWDNSSGLYPTWAQASVAWENGVLYAGRSPEYTLANIGGAVNTAPVLFPVLVTFRIGIIPEPTTTALAGLGATAFLVLGRRKFPTNYL